MGEGVVHAGLGDKDRVRQGIVHAVGARPEVDRRGVARAQARDLRRPVDLEAVVGDGDRPRVEDGRSRRHDARRLDLGPTWVVYVVVRKDANAGDAARDRLAVVASQERVVRARPRGPGIDARVDADNRIVIGVGANRPDAVLVARLELQDSDIVATSVVPAREDAELVEIERLVEEPGHGIVVGDICIELDDRLVGHRVVGRSCRAAFQDGGAIGHHVAFGDKRRPRPRLIAAGRPDVGARLLGLQRWFNRAEQLGLRQGDAAVLLGGEDQPDRHHVLGQVVAVRRGEAGVELLLHRARVVVRYRGVRERLPCTVGRVLDLHRGEADVVAASVLVVRIQLDAGQRRLAREFPGQDATVAEVAGRRCVRVAITEYEVGVGPVGGDVLGAGNGVWRRRKRRPGRCGPFALRCRRPNACRRHRRETHKTTREFSYGHNILLEILVKFYQNMRKLPTPTMVGVGC